MSNELLIDGSNGDAGRLITHRAIEEGLSPVLAGGRTRPVETLATDLGLDHRVFSLEHRRVIEECIDDIDAVLNCAGPFTSTSRVRSTSSNR